MVVSVGWFQIPYMGHGCLNKHPFQTACLEFRFNGTYTLMYHEKKKLLRWKNENFSWTTPEQTGGSKKPLRSRPFAIPNFALRVSSVPLAGIQAQKIEGINITRPKHLNAPKIFGIAVTIWKDLETRPQHLKSIARRNEVSLRFALHIGLAFFVDGPTISYLISAAADVNEQLDIPFMRKGGLVGCLLGWRESESSKKRPSVEAMEGTRTAKKVRCNAGVHLH